MIRLNTDSAIKDVIQFSNKDERVVFVSGNFNVVHPGHLRLLKFAKDCGDKLVVGIHTDDQPGTLVSQQLRLESVRSISFVDQAFLLEERPESFISRFKPAVVVKGKEHEGQLNPEEAATADYGGKLLFASGEMRFSSFDLIRSEFSQPIFSTILKPVDFLERHKIESTRLLEILQKFKDLRVTVLGDVIVDEYIACDALGMSQEDATLVVSPVLSERYIGGAGIVAAHAAGLGAKVKFFSVSGADYISAIAQDKLSAHNVVAKVFEDESRPTTLKQRYRANGKTLLRVSHLKQHDISRNLIDQLWQTLRQTLEETDLLIFSDFNYGCLPQVLVDRIIGYCSERKIPMVADSQSSSQVGDVSRFTNMLLLTPTEREARLAVRDFSSGLVVLAEQLRQKAQSKNIVVTLASEGVLIHAPCSQQKEWLTDRLPALNQSPKDTAGAGDSLLTCSSMALIVGANIWEATYLGALAAACQVGRIGNIPLTVNEIKLELM